MAERDRTREDILVIVDQLDRIPQKVINDQGLTNQRNIYLDHAAILRSLDCHVLYTVPIELAFSEAHLRLKAAYGGETLLLPLIPVSQRNGEDCLHRQDRLDAAAGFRRRRAGAALPSFRRLHLQRVYPAAFGS